MVNASGGIYGRKLNLTELNTSYDPGVGLTMFTKYIPQMFAMNGTQSNVDSVGFVLRTAQPGQLPAHPALRRGQ
jgi:hypothetical protein